MPKYVSDHQVFGCKEGVYKFLCMCPDKETALRNAKKALRSTEQYEEVVYMPPVGSRRVFVMEGKKVKEVKKGKKVTPNKRDGELRN